MVRIVVLVAALLTLSADDGWATAQIPELITVNGRRGKLFSTPLSALLERRKDLESVLRSGYTSCHRGYVGKWAIEGDQLYLVSLTTEGPNRTAKNGTVQSTRKQIRLSMWLSDDDGPVPATWFSGTLRVEQGVAQRTVHVGFSTASDRELHVEIVRGRVVSQRVVNQIYENRGRSGQDIQWVQMASSRSVVPLPHDDGLWTDARLIAGHAFRESTPTGRRFLTRGVFDRGESGTNYLWIPRSLVTPEIWIPLRRVPPKFTAPTWGHVEVEATWVKEGDEIVLHIRWIRVLRVGETIHHGDFPLPELTTEQRRKLVQPDTKADPSDPFGARKIDTVWPGIVRARRGTLTMKAGVAAVRGVEVYADTDLVGKEVTVSGAYEMWEITERLLALDLDEVRPFRSRGPGVYTRVIDPETGALARPALAETPKPERD